jgi:outer membrane protein TolC
MRPFVFVVMSVVVASRAVAQQPITLQELHDSATRADPRARQVMLLREQSTLRLANHSVELLPAVSADASAQYQSDVVHVPVPGAPTPPNDTYDARFGLTQRLLDPSHRARRALILAQSAHAEAQLNVRLYATREAVNDAFFAALLAQEQEDELRATLTGLEAQLALAANRVREGAALRSEEAVVRAELLGRRQMLVDAGTTRAAALVVLSDITGVVIDTTQRLVVPELSDAIARTARGEGRRQRPEYAELSRSRELLDRQDAARLAEDLPRIAAFGRAGYGRPGLNPLNASFDTYWLAGVQVQWSPLRWGGTRRDRELIEIQRRIIGTEVEALDRAITRSTTRDLATIERHVAAISLDEQIIQLREQVAEETQIRFNESAVTAAELIERQTELLAARIARAVHRVELA